MKIIKLKNKKKEEIEIFVDDDDYEKVSKLKWYLRSMNKIDKIYVVTRIQEKPIKWLLMHRMIMNAKDNEIVDHIDGNGCNNQKHNLRICSFSANSVNSKKRKRIKPENEYLPRGVTILRMRSTNGTIHTYYHAQIGFNKKGYNLGTYKSIKDAENAYLNAAKQLHGNYMRKIFIRRKISEGIRKYQ